MTDAATTPTPDGAAAAQDTGERAPDPAGAGGVAPEDYYAGLFEGEAGSAPDGTDGGSAPAPSGVYELVVPEALADRIQPDPEDPRWGPLQEVGRKHGFSQDAINDILALAYQHDVDQAAADDQWSADQAKALDAALGDNAAKIKDELGRWFGGLVARHLRADPLAPAEDQARAAAMLREAQVWTQSAEGVLLLKAIKDAIGEHAPPPPGPDAGPPADREITTEDYYKGIFEKAQGAR